jgi:hypothetical protein
MYLKEIRKLSEEVVLTLANFHGGFVPYIIFTLFLFSSKLMLTVV